MKYAYLKTDEDLLEYPYLLIRKSNLQKKIREYKRNFNKFKIFYAVKANSDENVIKIMNEHDIGFEVASLNEFRHLLELGINIGRIITSNSMNDIGFIRYAYQRGHRYFTVDSSYMISELQKVAPEAEVMIRVDIPDSTSFYPLSGKFGATIADAEHIIEALHSKGLKYKGVMFHVGSQAVDISIWEKAFKIVEPVILKANSLGMKTEILNIGGGFPVEYLKSVPTSKQIAVKLNNLIESSAVIDETVTFYMEPGRGLIAEAGDIFAKVIYLAQKQGTFWAVLDVGVFNGLTEIIGGFSFKITNESKHRETVKYNLVGPSCDSWDIIAEDVSLKKLSIGDTIRIHSVGAYSTEFASNFNGFEIPRIIIR